MKNIEKVKISTEFIKLDQFLKWLAVVDSGRRGRKIYPEYKVEIFDKTYIVE